MVNGLFQPNDLKFFWLSSFRYSLFINFRDREIEARLHQLPNITQLVSEAPNITGAGDKVMNKINKPLYRHYCNMKLFSSHCISVAITVHISANTIKHIPSPIWLFFITKYVLSSSYLTINSIEVLFFLWKAHLLLHQN